ncbi:MAG: DUF389 domain-containing protein [Xenococcaceae cyanobacterium]
MIWLTQLKKHIQQSWQNLTQDWLVMQEDPIPASELNQAFLQASLPTFNFYLLLTLAAAISTFGLLTNSAATIIGAMIIAPLMNPIASLAYALVVLSPRLLERAIFTLPNKFRRMRAPGFNRGMKSDSTGFNPPFPWENKLLEWRRR